MPKGWKIVGAYPADIVVTIAHATHVVKPGDHGVDPTKDAYKDMFSHVTGTIDISNPDGTEMIQMSNALTLVAQLSLMM
ncbi:hypothetical protein [uncultured Lactobacillus sp.]|uniref:hypothetical protein n=1 Tax=uncultured Lactobacillus sp. TaxID=153152 RepID=UPI00260576FE|nr:hypothetical protein [uncultured Lactobacillus sp.]